MSTLFLNLVLAHLVADFWLQSDGMVVNKRERKLRGWAIYVHALLVFLCTWGLGWFRFWPYALAIAVLHFAIDLIKVQFTRRPLIPFLVDQVVHITVLWVVAILYAHIDGQWTQFGFLKEKYAMLIPMASCALVIITRPANVLIKEIFAFCGVFEEEVNAEGSLTIDISKSCDLDKMKNAGAMVGVLERLIAAVFVVAGNYQALGFLLTAKSVLRFKLDDARKSEYVLVGTLLSMTIVLVCVLSIRAIWSIL